MDHENLQSLGLIMHQVNFTEKQVLFVNEKTSKAEGFVYFDKIEGKKAAGDLRKEVDGRPNLTRAALSVLIDVLQSDRLEGYKGKTVINAPVPKEFKQAIREVETAMLRPLFIENMPKSMSEAEKNKGADKYVSELWAGGVYALVKNTVSKYFVHCGKLPCAYDSKGRPDVSKLLSTMAIQKLIENEAEAFHKAHAAEEAEESPIKDKIVREIVKASHMLETRDGETNPPLPEVESAIAACKAMLATLEGIKREYAELATRARENVQGNAVSVIDKTKAAMDQASRKGSAKAVKGSAKAAKDEPALM